MKPSEALTAYFAEKDGLRGCPFCVGKTRRLGIETVYCYDCGASPISNPHQRDNTTEWNTRTADPIIRHLQAQLELAKGALQFYASDHATSFVDGEISQECPQGRGFGAFGDFAKEALTTLATDEWRG